MSRQRKTNPQDAIASAVSLFWGQGYNNVGTRQIDDETGITRFTLQTSYGGKMALFLQALDWYLDRFEEMGAPSASAKTLEELAVWFEARVEAPVMPEQSTGGCLLLNSIVEFGHENEDVNERSDRYFAFMRQRLGLILSRIVDAGNVRGDFDVSAHVEILMSCAIGMNILIRAAADNRAGRVSANACANMIRGWAA